MLVAQNIKVKTFMSYCFSPVRNLCPLNMENINSFLKSSTIHGLSYIATNRKFVKLFWIIVVITGFTCASILIHQSFEDWYESPVKTTEEALPISDLKLPKVTVCPPRNSYTDLNYDLILTENMAPAKGMRDELENYAKELLYDEMFNTLLRNLSKLEDNERYYNWYHGYTQMTVPFEDLYNTGSVNYQVYTSATSGNISTRYFGHMFDVDKVDANFYYQVNVNSPEKVKKNENVTLHFCIEKISMKDISRGEDRLEVLNEDKIDVDVRQITKSFSPPGDFKGIYLKRKVSMHDVRKQTLDQMPGFRFSWYFSGIQKKNDSAGSDFGKYIWKERTLAFIRKGSINEKNISNFLVKAIPVQYSSTKSKSGGH